MTDHFAFLALGLGNGAVYAALGLALVMTYKSSGVVNFATEKGCPVRRLHLRLSAAGELLNPIPGLNRGSTWWQAGRVAGDGGGGRHRVGSRGCVVSLDISVDADESAAGLASPRSV